MVRVESGSLQILDFRFLGLSFRVVPFLPVCVFLCKDFFDLLFSV